MCDSVSTGAAHQHAGTFETLRWVGRAADGHLELIDQTVLPAELKLHRCQTTEDVWESIRSLRVRGAPAIGLAAAYGVCLGMQPDVDSDRRSLRERLQAVADYLATSRPTAVNLFWALDRMRAVGAKLFSSPNETADAVAVWRDTLLVEACEMHEEDRRICRAIGEHASALLAPGGGILTHCNAGGLATSELGTALAGIVTAHRQGVPIHVFVDETRPLLQGSRLTAWELQHHGVPATLICDAMAGQVMKEGRVQAVITGADRIAANGDVANKIGTYSLAVLARAHGIPFYVAAPVSTFDLALQDGGAIPIEQRDAMEVTQLMGRPTAPAGIAAYNPAFDVTPADLITAIITERGIIRPVNHDTVQALCHVPGSFPECP